MSSALKLQLDTKSTLTALLKRVIDIKNALVANELACLPENDDTLRLRSLLKSSADLLSSRVSKHVTHCGDEGTYFELLSNGPLEIILRFLISSSPYRTAHCTVPFICLSKGVLGKLFRQRFTGIIIASSYLVDKFHIPRDQRSVLLNTIGRTSDAKTFLEDYGAAVIKLSFFVPNLIEYTPDLVSWINPFRMNCVALRELQLSHVLPIYVEKLLHARGKQLETLSIVPSTSRIALLHVAKFCKILRVLRIGPYNGVPDELWDTVSRSLQDLKLEGVRKLSRCSETLISVRMRCRAIQRISVLTNKESPTCGRDTTELLTSYGSSLQYVHTNFKNLSLSECKRIARECSNATFEFNGDCESMAICSALGGRVHKLRIGMLTTDVQLIDDAPEQFPILQNLSVKFCTANAMRLTQWILLTHPPELTTLWLQERNKGSSIEELLILAAASCTRLHNITVIFRGRQHKGLTSLIYANPLLENVMLQYSKFDNFNLDLLMPALLQCEMLRIFHIDLNFLGINPILPARNEKMTTEFISRMANSCLPLRKKGVIIKVFGICYNF